MTSKLFGPYRIERTLGHGGMGTVYAGVHQQTGERRAIKILAENLCADPRFRERFRCEIETLQLLHQENIVQLHGFGEEQGRLFFVMELVDGPSLDTELNAGRRLPWRQVAEIAIQVCAALKHAHDHGVIHRDLKPANLLLGADGKVKLTDFGIARLFGVSGLTLAGSMVGTPDYMSPEQTEGQPATPRSDLYSLGCVMYALLSGKPPFSGKSMTEVLGRVRTAEAVRLRRIVSEVPEPLDQIVMQLLHKDPARRIPTPQALAKLLRAMLHALPERSAADSAAPEPEGPAAETSRPAPRPAGEPMGTAERPTLDFTPEEAERFEAGKTDFRVTKPRWQPVAEAGGSPRAGTKVTARQATHFTLVDAEAGPRGTTVKRGAPEKRRREWLWIGVLALLLTAVASVIVWALLPMSADQHFARIQRWSRQSPPPFRYARTMNEFLQRYPEDPRAAEVQRLWEENARRELREELQTKLRSLTEAEDRFLQGLQHADDGRIAEACEHFRQIVDELGARDLDALGVTDGRVLQRSQYLLQELQCPPDPASASEELPY